jgi:type IV secretory pathway VirB2 component (pilin)
MSGFAPITAIRQAVFTKGSAHSLVRKGLSVVQFSVAVILIGWVLVIQTQMHYANHKDMGYNVQNVIGISLPWGQSNLDAVKNDFLAQASVSEVSFSSGFPFGTGSGRSLFKNLTVMQGGASLMNMPVNIKMSKFAPETIDLLQLKLIAGTTLPRPNDSIANIIINRKAVEYMETTPEEIIGKRLPSQFGNQPMYVCGVVENFYFPSLFEPVTPWGLHDASNQGFVNLLLKVQEGDMSQQIRVYEEIFKKHFPNDLFEAKFPEQAMAKAYEKVRQTGGIVLSFSILSILIACMGVFGLTAFMAEQRTKEIAIRKVFGASVSSIVRLFTGNYLRQLAVSLVIALPVVWWIGNKYLDDYADRISLSWWIFAAAALIVIVLTLCTVGYQAIKAATANPVKAIKSE